MRRLIILAEVALGLLFASCTKEEQRTLSVIPAPLKVELQQEVFSLNSETGLYIDASEGDKKILEDYLVASSMNLKPVIAEEGHNVVLKQVAELPEVNSSEGYVLTVTPDQVLIRATSGAGLFYGQNTPTPSMKYSLATANQANVREWQSIPAHLVSKHQLAPFGALHRK